MGVHTILHVKVTVIIDKMLIFDVNFGGYGDITCKHTFRWNISANNPSQLQATLVVVTI